MKELPSQQRIVNFDILRNLSMLMIVGIHFYTHGVYKYLDNYISYNLSTATQGSDKFISIFNILTSEYLFIIYCIGVNCFVLISGYFMVNKSLKINRLVSIWIQTFFYAIIIPFVFCFLTKDHDSAVSFLLKGLTPIRSKIYWFVTIYMGLMFVSPFLSLYAKKISKKMLATTLLVLLLINITISFDIPFGDIYGGGTSLLYFIFLFLVGAYIRLHDIKWKKCQYGRYFFVLSLFVICYTLAQELIIGNKHNLFLYHIYNSYNSLLFFMSVLAFLWFKNYRFPFSEKQKTYIFKLSPYVFGVYLFSDHPLVRTWLWSQIDWNSFFTKLYFIPLSFIVIITVFVFSLFVDVIRALLFRLIKIEIVINHISLKIETFINYCYNFL